MRYNGNSYATLKDGIILAVDFMIVNKKTREFINSKGLYTFGTQDTPYLDKHYNSYLLFASEDKTKEYIKNYGMGEQEVYKVILDDDINIFSLHKKHDFDKYCRFARKYNTLKDFFKIAKFDGYFHEEFSPNFSEKQTKEIFDSAKEISVFNINSFKILKD